MSGGSLDYGQYKLDEMADNICSRSRKPIHRAFATHLRKVGKAVHDLEWMFSCDTSAGDEIEAIKSVISPSDILTQATQDAEIMLGELKEAIKEAAQIKEAVSQQTTSASTPCQNEFHNRPLTNTGTCPDCECPF
jgi:hypothetical protein